MSRPMSCANKALALWELSLVCVDKPAVRISSSNNLCCEASSFHTQSQSSAWVVHAKLNCCQNLFLLGLSSSRTPIYVQEIINGRGNSRNAKLTPAKLIAASFTGTKGNGSLILFMEGITKKSFIILKGCDTEEFGNSAIIFNCTDEIYASCSYRGLNGIDWDARQLWLPQKQNILKKT